MFSRGEYQPAKPTFERLVKRYPNNGNYNLWYGICCLRTGEAEKAIKPLETAVKRRVTSGRLYLTEAYNAVYRFKEAVECCQLYLDDLKRRRKNTREAEQWLKTCQRNLRMIRGVEQVCVIDSFTVPKAALLQAYHIGPEAGKLSIAKTDSTGSGLQESITYETELGNLMLYSQLSPTDSLMHLYTRHKTQDGWGKEQPLSLSEDTCNENYPYLLSDGATLYYASDGPNSIGGYDIFVTRHNGDTFLASENIGMPFNSPANDYLYVIDEFNNLGWFASDRYQPNDTVCVYVFIPNTIKRVYDHETTPADQLALLAALRSIKATWTDDNTIASAQKRLALLKEQPASDGTSAQPEFKFIIDDRHVYYRASDFRSPQALELFRQYDEQNRILRQQQELLKQTRRQYAEASPEQKAELSPSLLDLEKRIRKLKMENQETAKQARNHEIATF